MNIDMSNHPKRYNVGTQHVIVRATASDTKGLCSVLEMHHPESSGPPLHYHKNEDEGFYVLEGRYQFTLGDETKTLGPGQFIMAPKDTPHSFKSLGPGLSKLLVYFTPGGVESYFEEMSLISINDWERGEKCATLDLKYGIVMGRP